jgi:hypothetical protein
MAVAGWARIPAATPAAPQSPTYDSSAFVVEVGRLKNALEAARQSSSTLRSFRESIPEAWIVDAAGRRYSVPSSLLVSRLQKAERESEVRNQQLEQAREYLDALAEETTSLSAQPSPQADSARAQLDAILAHPEYKRSRQRSWTERVRARIDEFLYNLIIRIFRGVGGQKSLGAILLWIGICAAAVLIAYWIFRRWYRAAWTEEMALVASRVSVRSWQEWVFSAREAAERSDYRMAIHSSYWAGITRLQDLGLLSADRSRTPREYLRALAVSKVILPESLASRQQALSGLTSRLERVWYGYQIATEKDFSESLSQLEKLGCLL